MLLPRWHETLERFRDRPAIFDGGSVFRFSDLAGALATLPRANAPLVCSGPPFEIALATLHGWRDSQPVVPVEQSASILPELGGIPPETTLIKLTPGNEGAPRGVRFTAAQIAADADRLVAAMGLRPGVPHLAVVTLTQSYGYSNLILPLLLHGIPIQTAAVPFPAVVAAAWKDHLRIAVPAVPSMWRAWLRSGILKDAPIALAISAGAPLSLDLEQAAWDSHQLKIHNFYGASECGGISFDASDTPRSHPDDLGPPLPGVVVELSTDHRFLIRSSSVALGCDQPRPGEVLGGSTFLTPDYGHLENGRLHLDSRGGDSINVAGRKLGPGRIEAVLKSTGLLDRIRVFGVPSADPERVDEIAALIPSATDLPALRAAAASLLAGWEIPRHWIPTAGQDHFQLPRPELRERFRPTCRPPTADHF